MAEAAVTCPKEEILRRLQRETTCSACCNALRLMMERRLSDLPLLVSFVEREHNAGSYVLRESLASSEALEAACAKFPLHEWLKNCQPLKRDKRCPMHTNSRNIFNQADLWEDMWAELSTAQKSTICGVAAEELHDKLWQHCTDKHHLCKDCRNNVMWAFDKLTKKESASVGTEAEQEVELSSLQAYFDLDACREGCICVHSSALPTILYHYEDTLAEEAESSAKGRHAPTRQAGLSEMLCVVGRLLLRKVLTTYQTSLEEEQNQQLLVRLVLSHFQAQTLERQAQECADSLLEEDAGANGKASKRKLKKERQKRRQEASGVEEPPVAWDEQQELALLSKMGWSKDDEAVPENSGSNGELEGDGDPGADGDGSLLQALDAMDTASIELTESEQREFDELAQHKGQLMEERRRMREALKQRFEEFCVRKAEPILT